MTTMIDYPDTTTDTETRRRNGWGGRRTSNRPKPPKPLSDRQRVMLAFIIRYKEATQGHSPTIREMRRATGISSTSVVNYNLSRLAARGYIELVREGAGRALDIRVPGAKWIAPDEVEVTA